jgi:hypothetical protein
MEQGAAQKHRNQGWSQTSQNEIEERKHNTYYKSLKR